jgi:hypothetical protein
MTPPVRPEPVPPPVNPFGTMGGERSTPLQPQQRMRAALAWLKERGATMAELNAEIDRWKPKIAEFNRREQAEAGSPANLAVQGISTPFADEIAGAADAVGAMIPGGQSPGEAYRSTRDAIAGTNAARREVYPGQSAALEIGGGVASGIAGGVGAARAIPGAAAPVVNAIGRMLPATTKMGRLGRTVAATGTAGAVAGAGGAEPGERDRGALVGGAFGVAGGTALQAAGGMGGALVRRLGFGPRAPETVVGRLRSAVGAQTPEQAAVDRITREVEASGRTVEDVLAPTADLDPTAMLADVDVGGQKAARLAGTGRRLGENAAERAEATLGARSRDRGIKIGADLSRISGVQPFNPDDATQTLIAKARREAKPLYDEVKKFPAVADPRVNEAIELLPEGRLAEFWKRVVDVSRLEGRRTTRNILTPEGKLAHDLEPHEMDLVKRALDEVLYVGGRAAKAAQPGGLSNTETALLQRARSLIVEAAEDATGGPSGVYARARAVYGGPVSVAEAMEQGANVPRMSIPEAQSAGRGMSPVQREAFGQGGVQAMREATTDKASLGKIGVARAFTSPQREAQMSAALNNPERTAQWQRLMRGEMDRERTEGIVMRGSPTAERLADDEMATVPVGKGGMIRTALDLVGMSPERIERAIIRGSTAPEMDAVTHLLTENVGDKATRARVLKLLSEGKTARADMAAKDALRKAGIVVGVTPRGDR